MTLQSIRDWLAHPQGRVIVRTLAVSLVMWAGASTANATIDLGAALHDATCPEHAAQQGLRR